MFDDDSAAAAVVVEVVDIAEVDDDELVEVECESVEPV